MNRPTPGKRETLDVDHRGGYALPVAEALAKKQPRSESEEAERERVVAKIERSLASLDAGLGVPHADVLEMLDERYPGSK